MTIFKNKLTLLIILIFLSFSCSSNFKKDKDFYIISNDTAIIKFEQSDHRFCNSLNLSVTNKKSEKNELYWRCRLSLTKHRLKTDITQKESIDHNIKIGKIITQISLKLSKTPKMLLENANADLDKYEHEKCQLMGYNLDTDNQEKIDEYFLCRKILIEDRISFPAFHQSDFLDYQNDHYNLGYTIDKRLDSSINEYNRAKNKYPNCIIHKISSQDFTNCSAAYDASRRCFLEIDSKKFNREAQKKITCQRQAAIRFPDKFINQDNINNRNIKAKSDYYNNNDFSSLGIDDVTKFYDTKKSDKSDKVEHNSLIGSKNQLYSKFEIIKLREKYIKSCQVNADIEIVDYVTQLRNACEALKKYN